MPYRRELPALATWHSQNGLLVVAYLWGMSYLIPEHDRIAFSEVYPVVGHIMPAMWVWGWMLVLPATLALFADVTLRLSKGRQTWSYDLAFIGHLMLASVYVALAVSALIEGLGQVTLSCFPHGHFWGQLISALSRPALWSLITYLHVKFARLPRPYRQEDNGPAS